MNAESAANDAKTIMSRLTNRDNVDNSYQLVNSIISEIVMDALEILLQRGGKGCGF